MTDEELIKKVAEEVMGWRSIRSSHHGQHVVWVDATGKSIVHFYPLTNLNHAFMVVERIRELEFAVSLYNPWFDGAGMERKEWSVSFFTEINVIHGISQNIGHAICEAALKAVENG